MKRVLLILGLALLSCEYKHRIQEKTIRIYYLDGKTEILTLKEEFTGRFKFPDVKVYFHDNCLYRQHVETKYDANFQGCFRCGVVRYEVIKDYTNF